MKNDSTDKTEAILPSNAIVALIERGAIAAASPIPQANIQPASLDLRLGRRAFRLRASFLPGVEQMVHDKCARLMADPIDLCNGTVLETGCVYLIELSERLALPANIKAVANPKSSTGRIDVFARLITERGARFDTVVAGYHGRLYLEVCPQTFPIMIRAGSKLAQLRFKQVGVSLSSSSYTELLSLSLTGDGRDMPCGYRARRHRQTIDVDVEDALSVTDYWEPLYPSARGHLVLTPGAFYILATREKIFVPSTYAAELQPFDAKVGEFRVHYAGFFDPGFGADTSRAVLEIRSRDVPFIMEDGQPIGQLNYVPLCMPATMLYGGAGAHYQGQGLRLSKHFKSVSPGIKSHV